MQDSKGNSSKDDKRIYILSEERPAKAIVSLGVPLVLGMSIMVLYNLVDTYFIGLMRDDYQLAAVNLAYPVMMITIAVSNMVGTGASTLIARCLGENDPEKAKATLALFNQCAESYPYPGEQYILEVDRFQIEVMRNLDQVPAVGSLIVCAFPKLKDGVGFPARCFAICPWI